MLLNAAYSFMILLVMVAMLGFDLWERDYLMLLFIFSLSIIGPCTIVFLSVFESLFKTQTLPAKLYAFGCIMSPIMYAMTYFLIFLPLLFYGVLEWEEEQKFVWMLTSFCAWTISVPGAISWAARQVDFYARKRERNKETRDVGE